MTRYGQRFVWLVSPSMLHRCCFSSRFNTGEKNYYSVLKITPSATQEEIKKAYYKLSKLYHPDTNQSDKAHEAFTAINEAYKILGNLPGRRKYDQGLTVKSNTTMATKHPPKSQQFDGKRIVHDFDEWSERYYAEAVKRRKRHFAMKKQFERRHVSDDMEIFNRNIIITAVLTLIGLVVLANGKVYS